MDEWLRQSRYTLLFTLGFLLFVATVVTDNSWLLAPATIFVIVAAVGRPLSEVRWPGGAVRWQKEAIQQVHRVAYEELPPEVRRDIEEAEQTVDLDRLKGTTAGPGLAVGDRPVSPDDFARAAVHAVLQIHKNAEQYARHLTGRSE